MKWEVEFTGEFGHWWRTLTESQQDDVARSVGMLADLGSALGYGTHLKELRREGKL